MCFTICICELQQQTTLKMIVSRDVNYTDMFSSSYKMPVTLNEFMSDVSNYKISTRFRLNFPYGISEVIKAIKIHPTFTVQFKSNMSLIPYMTNMTEYFTSNAKINAKIYKSCRQFSITPLNNFSKDSSNNQCYTSNSRNYDKIISFLEYYYNKFGISKNDTNIMNFSNVKLNIYRFIKNINDFDDQVGSLSFPCRLHGFSSNEQNTSSQKYFTEDKSETEHLLFTRNSAPFRININSKNSFLWSNIYDISVFFADDLKTTSGFHMDTTDAINLNSNVLLSSGLNNTIFKTDVIDLSNLDFNNFTNIDLSDEIKKLCINTIDMFTDENNPKLFSSYYMSNDMKRPMIFLEPTSIWISIEITLPTQTSLSKVINLNNISSQLSNEQLKELVLVTLKFPTWKPDYDIIKQHQSVFGSNDYIFENVVTIFDCNSFFFKQDQIVYSPFYLSPKYREFKSQTISSVDIGNFYGLNWNYLQTYSPYDSKIYDERGFDTCFGNFSPFFQPTTTGVGARGLFSYIPTQTEFIPTIGYNVYAIQYVNNQIGLNYDILSPDLYHPLFVLNSSNFIYQEVYINFSVPIFNVSNNSTNISTTLTPNNSNTNVTQNNTDYYEENLDDDILDHYNISLTDTSGSGSRKSEDLFKNFSLAKGIDTTWSIIMISVIILSVLLFICYIRASSKNKNPDRVFAGYDDDDVIFGDTGYFSKRNNNNTCKPNIKFKKINCCSSRRYCVGEELIQDMEDMEEEQNKQPQPEKNPSYSKVTRDESSDSVIIGDKEVSKLLNSKEIVSYDINDDTGIIVVDEKESSSDNDDSNSIDASTLPSNPLYKKKKGD